LSAVNVAETILVFVGAPLAVVVVLALLIYLPGGRKRPRYKSGQPWPHEPVWYEPHPEGPAGDHGGGYGAGVPGQGTLAVGSSVYGEPTDGHGHGSPGATAVGGAPAPRASAGPLGGARGTW
jgi:hypothetical protein